MSLSPVIYVDNQTVIGASNLNAIQDAILANEQGLANKVNTTDYNPNAKTSDMIQPVGKDGSGKLWTKIIGNDYNPSPKTSDMNQPVGKDSEGKLWTKLIGGAGLIIKGYYPTLSDLQEAVPNPSLGDAYGVGTSAPYYIYVWSGTSWVDNGTLVSVASVNNQLGVVQLDGSDINVNDSATTPQTIKAKLDSIDNINTQQSSDIVALNSVAEQCINQWAECWKNGYYNISTGAYVSNNTQICCANRIPCKPNTTYYIKGKLNILTYTANDTYIDASGWVENATFTTQATAKYIRFYCHADYGATYNNDISINYPSTYTGYYPAKLSLVNANQGMISDAWNSATTYTVGQYCISGNQLYKCKVQHSNVQPPNSTYWNSVSVGREISTILTKELITLNPTMPDSDTTLYQDGIYCIKSGKIISLYLSIKITNAQTEFANRKIIALNLPSGISILGTHSIIIDNGDVIGYTKATISNSQLVLYPQVSGTTYAMGTFIFINNS